MSTVTSISAANTGGKAPAFNEFQFGGAIADAPPPLPCPFCGNDSPSIEQHETAKDCGADLLTANCQQCGSEGPAGTSQLEACKEWNQRAAIGNHFGDCPQR